MVSSRELGEALGVTAAQVRRDLGYFGQFGSPGLGYPIDSLAPQIRRILGIDKPWRVALVGIGKLGGALVHYRGFERQGFQIAALFDRDPAIVGREFPVGRVEPIDRLAAVVREKGIRLAIITVPGSEAQAVLNELVASGVEGVFNFAPTALAVPAGVAYVSIDLAMQLEQLTYMVSQAKGKEGS